MDLSFKYVIVYRPDHLRLGTRFLKGLRLGRSILYKWDLIKLSLKHIFYYVLPMDLI